MGIEARVEPKQSTLTKNTGSPFSVMARVFAEAAAADLLGPKNDERQVLQLGSGIKQDQLPQYEPDIDFRNQVILGKEFTRKETVTTGGWKLLGGGKQKEKDITGRLGIRQREDRVLSSLPEIQTSSDEAQDVFAGFLDRMLNEFEVSDDELFTNNGELTKAGQQVVFESVQRYFTEAVEVTGADYAKALNSLSEILGEYKNMLTSPEQASRQGSIPKEVADMLLEAKLATDLITTQHLVNRELPIDQIVDKALEQRHTVTEISAPDILLLENAAQGYERLQSKTYIPTDKAGVTPISGELGVSMTVEVAYKFANMGFNNEVKKVAREAVAQINRDQGTNLTIHDLEILARTLLREKYAQEQKLIVSGEMNPGDASIMEVSGFHDDEIAKMFFTNEPIDEGVFSRLSPEQQKAINISLNLIRLTGVVAAIAVPTGVVVQGLGEMMENPEDYTLENIFHVGAADSYAKYTEATSGYGSMPEVGHNDDPISALQDFARGMADKRADYKRAVEMAKAIKEGDIHRVEDGVKPMVYRTLQEDDSQDSNTGEHGSTVEHTADGSQFENQDITDQADIDTHQHVSTEGVDDIAGNEVEGIQPENRVTQEQIQRFKDSGERYFEIKDQETVSHAVLAIGASVPGHITNTDLFGEDGKSGMWSDLKTNSVAFHTDSDGHTRAFVLVYDDPATEEQMFKIITPGTDVTREGARLLVVDLPDGFTPTDQGVIVEKVLDPIRGVIESNTINSAIDDPEGVFHGWVDLIEGVIDNVVSDEASDTGNPPQPPVEGQGTGIPNEGQDSISITIVDNNETELTDHARSLEGDPVGVGNITKIISEDIKEDGIAIEKNILQDLNGNPLTIINIQVDPNGQIVAGEGEGFGTIVLRVLAEDIPDDVSELIPVLQEKLNNGEINWQQEASGETTTFEQTTFSELDLREDRVRSQLYYEGVTVSTSDEGQFTLMVAVDENNNIITGGLSEDAKILELEIPPISDEQVNDLSMLYDIAERELKVNRPVVETPPIEPTPDPTVQATPEVEVTTEATQQATAEAEIPAQTSTPTPSAELTQQPSPDATATPSATSAAEVTSTPGFWESVDSFGDPKIIETYRRVVGAGANLTGTPQWIFTETGFAFLDTTGDGDPEYLIGVRQDGGRFIDTINVVDINPGQSKVVISNIEDLPADMQDFLRENVIGKTQAELPEPLPNQPAISTALPESETGFYGRQVLHRSQPEDPTYWEVQPDPYINPDLGNAFIIYVNDPDIEGDINHIINIELPSDGSPDGRFQIITFDTKYGEGTLTDSGKLSEFNQEAFPDIPEGLFTTLTDLKPKPTASTTETPPISVSPTETVTPTAPTATPAPTNTSDATATIEPIETVEQAADIAQEASPSPSPTLAPPPTEEVEPTEEAMPEADVTAEADLNVNVNEYVEERNKGLLKGGLVMLVTLGLAGSAVAAYRSEKVGVFVRKLRQSLRRGGVTPASETSWRDIPYQPRIDPESMQSQGADGLEEHSKIYDGILQRWKKVMDQDGSIPENVPPQEVIQIVSDIFHTEAVKDSYSGKLEVLDIAEKGLDYIQRQLENLSIEDLQLLSDLEMTGAGDDGKAQALGLIERLRTRIESDRLVISSLRNNDFRAIDDRIGKVESEGVEMKLEFMRRVLRNIKPEYLSDEELLGFQKTRIVFFLNRYGGKFDETLSSQTSEGPTRDGSPHWVKYVPSSTLTVSLDNFISSASYPGFFEVIDVERRLRESFFTEDKDFEMGMMGWQKLEYLEYGRHMLTVPSEDNDMHEKITRKIRSILEDQSIPEPIRQSVLAEIGYESTGVVDSAEITGESITTDFEPSLLGELLSSPDITESRLSDIKTKYEAGEITLHDLSAPFRGLVQTIEGEWNARSLEEIARIEDYVNNVRKLGIIEVDFKTDSDEDSDPREQTKLQLTVESHTIASVGHSGKNEDAVFTGKTDEGKTVIAVLDGVGSESSTAAAEGVKIIKDIELSELDGPHTNKISALFEGVQRKLRAGPVDGGTTLSAGIIDENWRFNAGSVGDSPIILITLDQEKPRVEILTRLHTKARYDDSKEQGIERDIAFLDGSDGELRELFADEDAKGSTRDAYERKVAYALNSSSYISPDEVSRNLKPGQIVAIMSDGLTGNISLTELALLFDAEFSVEEIVQFAHKKSELDVYDEESIKYRLKGDDITLAAVRVERSSDVGVTSEELAAGPPNSESVTEINPILTYEEQEIVDKAVRNMRAAYYVDTQVIGLIATHQEDGRMQINTERGINGGIERTARFPEGGGWAPIHHVREEKYRIFEDESTPAEFKVITSEFRDKEPFYGEGVLRIFTSEHSEEGKPSEYSVMMDGFVSTGGEKGRGLGEIELDFVFSEKKERDSLVEALKNSDNPKRLIAGLINQTFQDGGKPASVLNVEDDSESGYQHPIYGANKIVIYDPEAKTGKIFEKKEERWVVEYESIHSEEPSLKVEQRLGNTMELQDRRVLELLGTNGRSHAERFIRILRESTPDLDEDTIIELRLGKQMISRNQDGSYTVLPFNLHDEDRKEAKKYLSPEATDDEIIFNLLRGRLVIQDGKLIKNNIQNRGIVGAQISGNQDDLATLIKLGYVKLEELPFDLNNGDFESVKDENLPLAIAEKISSGNYNLVIEDENVGGVESWVIRVEVKQEDTAYDLEVETPTQIENITVIENFVVEPDALRTLSNMDRLEVDVFGAFAGNEVQDLLPKLQFKGDTESIHLIKITPGSAENKAFQLFSIPQEIELKINDKLQTITQEQIITLFKEKLLWQKSGQWEITESWIRKEDDLNNAIAEFENSAFGETGLIETILRSGNLNQDFPPELVEEINQLEISNNDFTPNKVAAFLRDKLANQEYKLETRKIDGLPEGIDHHRIFVVKNENETGVAKFARKKEFDAGYDVFKGMATIDITKILFESRLTPDIREKLSKGKDFQESPQAIKYEMVDNDVMTFVAYDLPSEVKVQLKSGEQILSIPRETAVKLIESGSLREDQWKNWSINEGRRTKEYLEERIRTFENDPWDGFSLRSIVPQLAFDDLPEEIQKEINALNFTDLVKLNDTVKGVLKKATMLDGDIPARYKFEPRKIVLEGLPEDLELYEIVLVEVSAEEMPGMAEKIEKIATIQIPLSRKEKHTPEEVLYVAIGSPLPQTRSIMQPDFSDESYAWRRTADMRVEGSEHRFDYTIYKIPEKVTAKIPRDDGRLIELSRSEAKILYERGLLEIDDKTNTPSLGGVTPAGFQEMVNEKNISGAIRMGALSPELPESLITKAKEFSYQENRSATPSSAWGAFMRYLVADLKGENPRYKIETRLIPGVPVELGYQEIVIVENEEYKEPEYQPEDNFRKTQWKTLLQGRAVSEKVNEEIIKRMYLEMPDWLGPKGRSPSETYDKLRDGTLSFSLGYSEGEYVPVFNDSVERLRLNGRGHTIGFSNGEAVSIEDVEKLFALGALKKTGISGTYEWNTDRKPQIQTNVEKYNQDGDVESLKNLIYGLHALTDEGAIPQELLDSIELGDITDETSFDFKLRANQFTERLTQAIQDGGYKLEIVEETFGKKGTVVQNVRVVKVELGEEKEIKVGVESGVEIVEAEVFDPVDITTRVLNAMDTADNFVPQNPQQNFMVGEYFLTMRNDPILGKMMKARNDPIWFILGNFPIQEMGVEPLIQILNTTKEIVGTSGTVVRSFTDLGIIPIGITKQLIAHEDLKQDVREILQRIIYIDEVKEEFKEQGFKIPIELYHGAHMESAIEMRKQLNFFKRIRGLDEEILGRMQTSFRDFILSQNDEVKDFTTSMFTIIGYLGSSKRNLLNDRYLPYCLTDEEGYESIWGQRPGLVDVLVTGLSIDELEELSDELQSVLKLNSENVQLLDDIKLIQRFMANEDEYVVTGVNRTGMTSDVYFIETPTGHYAVKAFASKSFRDGSEISREDSEIGAYQIPGIERHTLKTTDFGTTDNNGIVLYRGQILKKDSTPEKGMVTIDGLVKTIEEQGPRGIYNVIKSMTEFYKLAIANGYSPGFDYKPESYGFRVVDGETEFITYDLGDFYHTDDPKVVLEDFCEMIRCNTSLLDNYIKFILKKSPYSFDSLIIIGANRERFFPVTVEEKQLMLKEIDEQFAEGAKEWEFLVRIYKTANKRSPTRTMGLLNEHSGMGQVDEFETLDELLRDLEEITRE